MLKVLLLVISAFFMTLFSHTHAQENHNNQKIKEELSALNNKEAIMKSIHRKKHKHYRAKHLRSRLGSNTTN